MGARGERGGRMIMIIDWLDYVMKFVVLLKSDKTAA